MNLLRRAASEALRRLGVNVPTALTVIVGIGLLVLLEATSLAPVTDSRTGLSRWLIKSVVWLTPVVIVFIPLLAWNFLKVAGRERSLRANLEMAAESAASADEKIKVFLRNSLSDSSYGVAKCYAFGSLVGQYPTRDVDIIVQFDSSKPRQVRIYRERLREVESNFQEFRSLKLHIQTFLSSEDAAIETFLNKAGVHECIL